MSTSPFGLNRDRRTPRQQHRVTDRRGHDSSPRRRGSLTVRLTDEAIEGWAAEPCPTPGGRSCYRALAIPTALTLGAVFRLAYGRAEGLLGLAPRVPDHTTLSRRATTLGVPRVDGEFEPLHPPVDSTGLNLCGAGEWPIEEHDAKCIWRLRSHFLAVTHFGALSAATLGRNPVVRVR